MLTKGRRGIKRECCTLENTKEREYENVQSSSMYLRSIISALRSVGFSRRTSHFDVAY